MKQFGLSKEEKILSNRDFDRIYKEGKSRRKGTITVRFLPNNLEFSRLGIAVSKKVFRHAVERNRIKRLIREAFRLNKANLPKGLDMVVGVRINQINTEKHNINKLFNLKEIQADLMQVFV